MANPLIPPPSVQSSGSATNQGVSYSLVVKVPIPFLSVDIPQFVGAFALATLTRLRIPQATQFYFTKAQQILTTVIQDATKLITAIPDARVGILVQVGPVPVANVQLVAVKTPLAVPTPHFQLALKNFDYNFAVPFPELPPILIQVPIPVPQLSISVPTASITGGQVSATAQVQPVPVANPIVLPKL